MFYMNGILIPPSKLNHFAGIEDVDVTCATGSSAPSELMITSPTRHHSRAGDCAAGPDEWRLIGLPHPAAAVPDLLDRKPAGGVEDLREFSLQKASSSPTIIAGFFVAASAIA